MKLRVAYFCFMVPDQKNRTQEHATLATGVVAALLAGGRSRRMGRDKAFILHEGVALWQRQLTSLLEAGFVRLLMSCRREQGLTEAVERWGEAAGVGVQMVFDPPEGEANAGGPLAAVVRCLERAELPLLVLAVDMPLVTADFLRGLLAAGASYDGGVVVSRQGQVEPLISIWHPHSLGPLKAALAKPRYPSLKRLLEEEVACNRALRWEVPTELGACLENWNEPSDIRAERGFTS